MTAQLHQLGTPLLDPFEVADRSAPTARLAGFVDALPTTPVVAVDLEVVEQRFHGLRRELPMAEVYYAVKANPDPAIVGRLAGLGSRFDVASRPEVDLCLGLGVPGSSLSFGSTVKRSDDIAHARRHGVDVFAVDCPEELEKVRRHAPGSTVTVRLATTSSGARWPLSGKFGCGPEQAERLLRAATRAGHRVGLSFHVGSQQMRPEAWSDVLETVGRLAEAVEADGERLAVLNLGGGLPGGYTEPVAETRVYGEAIRRALDHHLPHLPELVMTEPGRYLTADAGVLVTEVVLATDRSDGRWLYLDAGVYSGLLETVGEAIRYPVVTDRVGRLVPTTLAGPTCDSADVLNPTTPYLLPDTLQAGDRLVLTTTGAYVTSTSSVSFNGFAPIRQECLG